VPACRICIGSPVAEHLDTGQTTPQASRWLPCTEGCGDELELRVAAPHMAWRAASRHGARVPHMHQVALSRSTSRLDRPHLKPRGGWLAQGAVAMSSSCGCCTPRGLAHGHPRRHGARVPHMHQVALSRSTSTLDRPHLKPQGGWLAQGAVAMSSSCGCCTPRGLARGQPTRCPRAAYASGHPVTEHLETGQTTPQASRWLACTEGCGDELELRVMHPTWPGAWPADTVPACRICIRSPCRRAPRDCTDHASSLKVVGLHRGLWL